LRLALGKGYSYCSGKLKEICIVIMKLLNYTEDEIKNVIAKKERGIFGFFK
jgi:hypothetical protein